MTLLQAKRSKQNWRMEILLCVCAATPAQHVSILLRLLDLLYCNSLTPYFYHLLETQLNVFEMSLKKVVFFSFSNLNVSLTGVLLDHRIA